jgi:prepilin-type N-terminal cleavage/methylation domain-containing protein
LVVKNKLRNSGFSLTEVLLSVGVLSIGMIFVAGVFPVGIHYTTIATERTKAAIVADEAFAKIKLYQDKIKFSALDDSKLEDFNDVLETGIKFDAKEYAYPSVYSDESEKYYYWSALCRLKEPYNDPNSG